MGLERLERTQSARRASAEREADGVVRCDPARALDCSSRRAQAIEALEETAKRGWHVQTG